MMLHILRSNSKCFSHFVVVVGNNASKKTQNNIRSTEKKHIVYNLGKNVNNKSEAGFRTSENTMIIGHSTGPEDQALGWLRQGDGKVQCSLRYTEWDAASKQCDLQMRLCGHLLDHGMHVGGQKPTDAALWTPAGPWHACGMHVGNRRQISKAGSCLPLWDPEIKFGLPGLHGKCFSRAISLALI